MDQFDREVERLEKDLDEGLISIAEFNQQMREIRYAHQAYAEERAQEAYNDIIDNYF